MFWKFGFHNASSIDALLDREDVSVEAILDEEDLLQECKAQNTRLLDYFQRADVLQRLLGHVSGEFDDLQDVNSLKYAYIATEVLCSEIWSIVEVCLDNNGRLLQPFWDSVLQRSPEYMKAHNLMASHFAKINSVFMNKKPVEMLAFIQSQPSIVERILLHIETPAFGDLLQRIVQLDEHPSCTGVLDWLSEQKLIQRMVDLVSPYQTSSMQGVVAELIKGITSLNTAAVPDNLQNGHASNLFARQLSKTENMEKLISYVLDDVPCATGEDQVMATPPAHSNGASADEAAEDSENHAADPVPNVETVVSAGVHAISIIIDLIRRNNSDYFEPYLFHTLRSQLMMVQQTLHADEADGRRILENHMKQMVDRIGLVNLSPLLEVMCVRLEEFQQLLRKPRSLHGPISTTVGKILPLTFERMRICELYAEVLHCSNMSFLNRSAEFETMYDSEGRLSGGLAALETLARVVSMNQGNTDRDAADDEGDEMEPAQELPVSSASGGSSLEGSDDDEDMSDDEDPSSSDDDVMEEIAMHEDPMVTPPPMSPLDDEPLEQPPLIVPSSPNASSLPPPAELAAQGAALAQTRRPSDSPPESRRRSLSRPRSSGSRRSLVLTGGYPPGQQPLGEKFKQRFISCSILSSLLDLFFAFPWNNFLHSTVYDVVHQILTARVDVGMNRELTIALFRDTRLMHRIVETQRENDLESAQPKGVRRGYMGHLTLISEDVIQALQHYPPDLRIILSQYAPQPEWDNYVGGRYHETKEQDQLQLGGGKPAVPVGGAAQRGPRYVDEADAAAAPGAGVATPPASGSGEAAASQGTFVRTGRLTRESSADFSASGLQPPEEEGSAAAGSAPQFARYLAQQMSSSAHSAGDDGSDEDEDEDGGWLSNQHRFDLAPPVTALATGERRPLSFSGLDDHFGSMISGRAGASFDNAFGDDDDAFSPFSDAAAAVDHDPFAVSGMAEDADDSSFDTFGDFGEFHSGGDGQLTPTGDTGDSWAFASDISLSSGSDDTDGDDAHARQSLSQSDLSGSDDPRTPTKTHGALSAS